MRVFAPFFKGDENLQKDMFQHLFNCLRNILEFKLYFDFRINMDKNSKLTQYF